MFCAKMEIAIFTIIHTLRVRSQTDLLRITPDDLSLF